MKTYFVLNDNTFGYPVADQSTGKRFFGLVVMAVDVRKGGDPTLIDRVTLCDSQKAREATKEDCERFKVEVGL